MDRGPGTEGERGHGAEGAPARSADGDQGHGWPADQEVPVAYASPTDPQGLDRRQDVVAIIWHIILILDLLLLGALFIYSALQALLADGDRNPVTITNEAVAANSMLLFILAGVIPFAWALGTRRRGLQGTLDFLWLRWRWRHLAEGFGWFIAVIATVLVIVMAEYALFGQPAENELLQQLQGLAIPVAVLVAVTAGVGEEILFRGVLLRLMRDSWWGVGVQAVLFGFAHAGYGTLTQVLAPLAIGVLFGVVVKWRRSLWVVIIAHTLYDLMALLLPRFLDT